MVKQDSLAAEEEKPLISSRFELRFSSFRALKGITSHCDSGDEIHREEDFGSAVV